MVIEVPGTPAAPGVNVPPDAMVTVCEPTVPVPVNVPPEFTVTLLELLIEPVTSSVPPLMVVAPL